MPIYHNNQPAERSHSSKQRQIFLKGQYHHPSKRQRSHRDRTHSTKSKGKAKNTFLCSGCQTLKIKLKEREQCFRQLIVVHHQQMKALQQANQDLREELDMLEERAQVAEEELQQLRNSKSSISLNNYYEQAFPTISAVGEPKVTASLKKLTSPQRSTFSQLLVSTPQTSQLGPSPLDTGQKQNALKSEFQRIMAQCTKETNRSRKATLRRQLAAIANQLTTNLSNI